jgi:hypothetical protein
MIDNYGIKELTSLIYLDLTNNDHITFKGVRSLTNLITIKGQTW